MATITSDQILAFLTELGSRYQHQATLHLLSGGALCLLGMDFSVLAQLTKFGPRSFPLTGLDDLEPEWQAIVVDLITSPPVNQLLKLSTYTPSLTSSIPVASVERPALALAA